MLIACKCLNIILKSAADHLPSTTSATISDYDDITIRTKTSIGLPSNMVSSTNDNNFDDSRQEQSPFVQDSTVEKLKSDQFHFFKTAKQLTDTGVESSIQHPNLVNVVPIGNWNLHSCRHCKMISHAESINSNKLLINPMLWTTPEKITSLKMQKNYSKSFNVLLMSTKVDPKQVESIDSGNIRTKQLRQHLSDAIQVETEATEQRIDQFTKQQMALLKMFRERAENDFQNILWALVRNVPNASDNEANADESSVGSLGTNAKLLLSDLTPPVTPDSTPMSIGNSPNFKQQTSFLMGSQNSMHKKQNTTNKSNHSMRTVQSSTPRDDIFFDMDGLDGFDARDAAMPESTQSDDDDDDDDDDEDVDDDEGVDNDEDIDNDEQDFDTYHGNRSNGIKIKPGQRKNNSSRHFVAQSLPMAVPIYSQRSDEEYDDYSDRQDNVDIAASIKALAKSVHGEAIFGDLPKPRFSSQI